MKTARYPISDAADHVAWLVENSSALLGAEPSEAQALALLAGYDIATGHSLLRGFQEWLVARDGGGYNIHWSGLAPTVATASRQSGPEVTVVMADQSGSAILDLVVTYLDEVDGPIGRRRLYARYEALYPPDPLSEDYALTRDTASSDSTPPDPRDHLRGVLSVQRQIFSHKITTDEALAFVLGYDLSCGRSLLREFPEWLVVKLGGGHGVPWMQLLPRLASGVGPGDLAPADTEDDPAGARSLEIVIEYLDDVADLAGRRCLYAAYERRLTADGLA